MSQYLKAFTDTHWTVAGFFIFFVLFLMFVASTYLKSQILIHDHLRRLPLEDATSGAQDER